MKCKICGKNIDSKNLPEAFQFTLGNMIFGKFIGEKSLYYHLKCLDTLGKNKPEFLTSYH